MHIFTIEIDRGKSFSKPKIGRGFSQADAQENL